MGNYRPLTEWLRNQSGDRIQISFEDIEDQDKSALNYQDPQGNIVHGGEMKPSEELATANVWRGWKPVGA